MGKILFFACYISGNLLTIFPLMFLPLAPSCSNSVLLGPMSKRKSWWKGNCWRSYGTTPFILTLRRDCISIFRIIWDYFPILVLKTELLEKPNEEEKYWIVASRLFMKKEERLWNSHFSELCRELWSVSLCHTACKHTTDPIRDCKNVIKNFSRKHQLLSANNGNYPD